MNVLFDLQEVLPLLPKFFVKEFLVEFSMGGLNSRYIQLMEGNVSLVFFSYWRFQSGCASKQGSGSEG